MFGEPSRFRKELAVVSIAVDHGKVAADNQPENARGYVAPSTDCYYEIWFELVENARRLGLAQLVDLCN